MEKFEQLSDLMLESVQGAGTPWGDIPNFIEFGDRIGRWLAHRPSGQPAPLPMCYEYGPAYPAPVLPCR
ncbi:hypothetical protein [Streptococcus himalayensis]|uniref:Uncharacterized protein n=1 Tax=Streptococcus himalayensis TaxID=1888195 RepID=A0A917EE92_9STRE|nr:hypothetical protein [Streptococcus himalayensis]GGE28995.1 hypothetical protein GCM10011510_07840 [Streptococcus himalayensis]